MEARKTCKNVVAAMFCQERWQRQQEVVSVIFLFCVGVVPFVISCIDISFVTGPSLWLVLVYAFS